MWGAFAGQHKLGVGTTFHPKIVKSSLSGVTTFKAKYM